MHYVLQIHKIALLATENPGCAILLAEKAPAGMGTPRPGFAKLRVSLERHSCCAKIAQWSGPRTPEAKDPKYVSFTKRNYILVAEKPRVRNFAGGKSPCGLGRPRPRLAKLRVSLERHSCCTKIAQWSGPRTAVYFERKISFLLPEEYVFFSKKNVTSSKRTYVFFTQEMCLLQTETVSSSDRNMSS